MRHNTLAYGVGSFHYLINRYKQNCKHRNKNIKWKLSEEESSILFQGACHYCGVPHSMVTTGIRANGSYTHNGIDRLDSDKDYTFDNCVSCCKICNRAKGDLPYADFISWINLISSKERQ